MKQFMIKTNSLELCSGSLATEQVLLEEIISQLLEKELGESGSCDETIRAATIGVAIRTLQSYWAWEYNAARALGRQN